MRDLKADLELCEKATEGTWISLHDELQRIICVKHINRNNKESVVTIARLDDDDERPDDFNFIAEAREALPYWLGRVRELEEELELKQSTLDSHYAGTERLWQWARENLTGKLSDQFWQIAANGYLLHENPEYHQRINRLKYELELANTAMEKQLPKKVTERHGDGGFCPVCHMHNLNVFQYCNRCGQRLSW